MRFSKIQKNYTNSNLLLYNQINAEVFEVTVYIAILYFILSLCLWFLVKTSWLKQINCWDCILPCFRSENSEEVPWKTDRKCMFVRISAFYLYYPNDGDSYLQDSQGDHGMCLSQSKRCKDQQITQQGLLECNPSLQQQKFFYVQNLTFYEQNNFSKSKTMQVHILLYTFMSSKYYLLDFSNV